MNIQRREKCFKSPFFIFFILFLLFALSQFLLPFSIPKNTLTDLSGQVLIENNIEQIDRLNFPSKVVYSLGDRLCHQKPERSFFLNGNQMPFCARCTAIWVGLVIGLGIMVFYRIQLDEKFFLLIIICLVPIGIDGIGQLLNFWESLNIIRVITGLLAGIICGIAIRIIIDEIKTIHLFKNNKK